MSVQKLAVFQNSQFLKIHSATGMVDIDSKKNTGLVILYLVSGKKFKKLSVKVRANRGRNGVEFPILIKTHCLQKKLVVVYST